MHFYLLPNYVHLGETPRFQWVPPAFKESEMILLLLPDSH